MTVPEFLIVPAPDDSGAETADRYDWQALTAAVDLMVSIALRTAQGEEPPTDVLLICEHHEDYVLCVGDEVTIISVKHRELSRGSWTFARLIDDGGLAHLFLRWRALREIPAARLTTNAGIASGDAKRLVDLCPLLRGDVNTSLPEADAAVLDAASRRILVACPEAEREELSDDAGAPTVEFAECVRRFLASLSFDCGRPDRHTLPSAAGSMYVSDFLRKLGFDPLLAEPAWELVGNLFRRRMRGRGPSAGEGLRAVARAISALSDEEALRSQLQDRLITARDVIEAIAVARSARIRRPDRTRELAPTRLALKLTNAGCLETTVHAAEAAAERWRNHESRLDLTGFGVAADLERVKTHALLVAASVEARAATPDRDYGPEMWSDLRAELTAEVLGSDSVVLDDDLALGIACDLASECRVWFSRPFDIERAASVFPGRLDAMGGSLDADHRT